jgi:hypothetical protein
MREEGHREVAIIVLNHNGLIGLGPRLLYRCLKSILETRYPSYVVLFVDNGSIDRSTAFVSQFFKDYIKKGMLRIIKLDKNYGWSGGNNRGALYAIKRYKPKYLVFLNNDIYIDDPFWLSKVLNAMNKYKLDLASPLVYELSLGLFSAGNIIGKCGESRPLIITETLLSTMKVHGMETISSKYLHGGALVVRTSVFTSLGGFDESFLAYYDETDFCERANRSSFRTSVIASTKVYHYGGLTFRKIQSKLMDVRTERVVESLLRFVRKHYGFTEIICAMLSLIKWLLAEIAKVNLKRALAILKGIISGFRNSLIYDHL